MSAAGRRSALADQVIETRSDHDDSRKALAAVEVERTTLVSGDSMWIAAVVTHDGAPAPDGIVVVFQFTQGIIDPSEAPIVTRGGRGEARFIATLQGAIEIVARVPNG